ADAAEADALPVMDARGNLDLERPLFQHATGAAALRAGRLDLAAGAAARRTRLRADELAEDAARHLLDPTGAAARRTRRDRAARLSALAAAVPAGDGDLEGDIAAGALRRLDEV